MFYIYIECDDGSPLFMKSEVFGREDVTVECMDGTVKYRSVEVVYEDVWHTSPIHATMFNDPDDAIRYVYDNHHAMYNVVKIMVDSEARQYL